MKSMQHESSRGLGNPIESDETSVLFTSRNGNGISAKRSVQAGQSDHRSMVVVKLLLFFFAFFPIAGYADLYSIASGPKNGYYHWIGESLASSVAAKKGHLLLNIESSGSIENLSLLQEELADFAILQHDLANEVHFEGNQYKHFSVLAPLFPEVAQIAIFGTHLKRSKNLSLTDLIDLFKTDQIEAIYTAPTNRTRDMSLSTLS